MPSTHQNGKTPGFVESPVADFFGPGSFIGNQIGDVLRGEIAADTPPDQLTKRAKEIAALIVKNVNGSITPGSSIFVQPVERRGGYKSFRSALKAPKDQDDDLKDEFTRNLRRSRKAEYFILVIEAEVRRLRPGQDIHVTYQRTKADSERVHYGAGIVVKHDLVPRRETEATVCKRQKALRYLYTLSPRSPYIKYLTKKIATKTDPEIGFEVQRLDAILPLDRFIDMTRSECDLGMYVNCVKNVLQKALYLKKCGLVNTDYAIENIHVDMVYGIGQGFDLDGLRFASDTVDDYRARDEQKPPECENRSNFRITEKMTVYEIGSALFRVLEKANPRKTATLEKITTVARVFCQQDPCKRPDIQEAIILLEKLHANLNASLYTENTGRTLGFLPEGTLQKRS